MTKIIRETDKFDMFQDEFGNIGFSNKTTGDTSDWFVGLEAQNKINHVKHLDDTRFNEYVNQVLTNNCY